MRQEEEEVSGSGEKIKDFLMPSCLITSFDFPSCVGGCPSASPGPPWPSCQKQEEETGPVAAIPGAGADPGWGERSAEPREPHQPPAPVDSGWGQSSPLRAQCDPFPHSPILSHCRG